MQRARAGRRARALPDFGQSTDYAGKKPAIVDPLTGEVTHVELFVAVMVRLATPFIYLESDELALARVNERVEQGGHRVPIEKIRERYGRLPDLVKQAIRSADKSFVVDNSYIGRALRDVLIFERGHLVYMAGDLPGGTRRVFGEALSPLGPRKARA